MHYTIRNYCIVVGASSSSRVVCTLILWNTLNRRSILPLENSFAPQLNGLFVHGRPNIFWKPLMHIQLVKSEERHIFVQMYLLCSTVLRTPVDRFPFGAHSKNHELRRSAGAALSANVRKECRSRHNSVSGTGGIKVVRRQNASIFTF